MTNPDCEECGGDGYIEIQTAVDDFRKVACECNQWEPDADAQYDEMKAEEAWEHFKKEDEKNNV